MSRAPERIETGTGPQRRRLTEAEAARGALPTPFTDSEWRAMRETVTRLDVEMMYTRIQTHRDLTDAHRDLSTQAPAEARRR